MAAVIVILIVVAFLALSEALLRVFDFAPLRLVPNDKRHNYGHDPELGWIGIANSVDHVNASRPITTRHNSLGLRDIEPAHSDGPTILFLGDSFVWGVDVEAEERFTDRLRSDIPAVRIVNAGIAGYGTDQEYVLLQRLWPLMKPSVVVLIFCGNDRDDNKSNYRYYSFKPYLTKVEDRWQLRGQPVPVAPQLYFYNNWFALHFASVRLAFFVYSLVQHIEVSVPDPTDQLITMMRDFIETRDAKFLIGLEPNDAALEAFLDTQKIPYTRLDDAERFPEWGCHWTPVGHVLVAERLLTLLSEEGVVSDGTGQQRTTHFRLSEGDQR